MSSLILIDPQFGNKSTEGGGKRGRPGREKCADVCRSQADVWPEGSPREKFPLQV